MRKPFSSLFEADLNSGTREKETFIEASQPLLVSLGRIAPRHVCASMVGEGVGEKQKGWMALRGGWNSYMKFTATITQEMRPRFPRFGDRPPSFYSSRAFGNCSSRNSSKPQTVVNGFHEIFYYAPHFHSPTESYDFNEAVLRILQPTYFLGILKRTLFIKSSCDALEVEVKITFIISHNTLQNFVPIHTPSSNRSLP